MSQSLTFQIGEGVSIVVVPAFKEVGLRLVTFQLGSLVVILVMTYFFWFVNIALAAWVRVSSRCGLSNLDWWVTLYNTRPGLVHATQCDGPHPQVLVIADNERAYGGCSISVREGRLTFIYLIYSIIYLLSIIYIIYCILMMSKRELNTGSTAEPLTTS